MKTSKGEARPGFAAGSAERLTGILQQQLHRLISDS